jgi:hypothetical protein
LDLLKKVEILFEKGGDIVNEETDPSRREELERGIQALKEQLQEIKDKLAEIEAREKHAAAAATAVAEKGRWAAAEAKAVRLSSSKRQLGASTGAAKEFLLEGGDPVQVAGASDGQRTEALDRLSRRGGATGAGAGAAGAATSPDDSDSLASSAGSSGSLAPNAEPPQGTVLARVSSVDRGLGSQR